MVLRIFIYSENSQFTTIKFYHISTYAYIETNVTPIFWFLNISGLVAIFLYQTYKFRSFQAWVERFWWYQRQKVAPSFLMSSSFTGECFIWKVLLVNVMMSMDILFKSRIKRQFCLVGFPRTNCRDWCCQYQLFLSVRKVEKNFAYFIFLCFSKKLFFASFCRVANACLRTERFPYHYYFYLQFIWST